MNSKHNFEMLNQELSDSIKHASEEEDAKTQLKAKRKADEGEAKGDLATTESDLAEDEKYLKELITECDTKSKDFEARQTLRKEELEALGKAIEIISSGDVSGNSEKHLPQLVQTSFAMLRAASLSPAQQKAAAFLQSEAAQHKSR